MGNGRDLCSLLDALDRELDEEGLDALTPYPVGHLARPRRLEVAAALNRLRGVRMAPAKG